MRNLIWLLWSVILLLPNNLGAQELLWYCDGFQMSYVDSPTTTIKTNGINIYYQRKSGCSLSIDDVVQLTELSLDRVRSLTGRPIRGEVDMFIPESIKDNLCDPKANLSTSGVRITFHEKNTIAIVRDDASIGLISHELLHSWFRSHNINPCEWWLEEGLCEFAESSTGFHAKNWDCVQNKGVLDLCSLGGSRPGQKDNDQVRATAWLLVYHARFVHPKRYTIPQYAKINFNEIKEPAVALIEVKKHLAFLEKYGENPVTSANQQVLLPVINKITPGTAPDAPVAPSVPSVKKRELELPPGLPEPEGLKV